MALTIISLSIGAILIGVGAAAIVISLFELYDKAKEARKNGN